MNEHIRADVHVTCLKRGFDVKVDRSRGVRQAAMQSPFQFSRFVIKHRQLKIDSLSSTYSQGNKIVKNVSVTSSFFKFTIWIDTIVQITCVKLQITNTIESEDREVINFTLSHTDFSYVALILNRSN